VRGDPLRDLLPEGRSVQATVSSGGEANMGYVLVVLRDESGELLYAYHDGGDELYRDGLFTDEETLGFTLAAAWSCRPGASSTRCTWTAGPRPTPS
jgi:hypothetical protein